MGLDGLLREFAGKTDSDVESYAARFSASDAVLDLIRRLKEKLIEQATSEEDKESIEESSKDGCSFFIGNTDELAKLLEDDFRNRSGLPFSPPILKKSGCGCDDHYEYWFMHHTEYGIVSKFGSGGRGVRIHQSEYGQDKKYDPNEYNYKSCGHTLEEIEDFISGNEESLAKKLANNHSDWCKSPANGQGKKGGAINQIPGFPGTCQEKLRIIVPLKAVITWTRLEQTASLLNRCSTIQTVGFVIGEESGASGEKFKRVWKRFFDSGNIPALPMVVGLIVANGDSSEPIQRWDGLNWL